jgi:arabinofuranosyltransferase
MEKNWLKNLRYSKSELGILYALWLALFAYIAYSGWVSEDAYITFRVVENFFDGYGLRWNTYERVQAYTHPLWMLLHIPIYAIWQNLFLGTVGLSVICAAFAALLIILAAQKSVLHTVVFFFLPFLAAKSVIDYTSSGLENPLSYLLFAAFIYVVLRKYEHRFFWLFCSLIVSLSLFNRLDTILIYAPTLAYLYHIRKPVKWLQIVIGMWPLLAWFSFSLLYYGFLFPNTKYAKLSTGMELWQYIIQGLHYGKYLLLWDSTGAVLLISCALFLLPARFTRFVNIPAHLPRLPTFLAIGMLVNSLYIFYVGGDYMAGRFWALPVFAALCLWFIVLPEKIRPDLIFAAICLFCTTYYIPQFLHDIRWTCRTCVNLEGRVIDARFVFRTNRVFMDWYPLKIRREAQYPFVDGGNKLKKENPKSKKLFYIGMTAYYAGNQIKIIDELGLADPLLARLPASTRQRFYIGHFRRDLPLGYQHAVETGELNRMHPSLARYYDKLRLIVSGDLLDKERLKTIMLFNGGHYDHWRRDYLNSIKKPEEPASAKPK